MSFVANITQYLMPNGQQVAQTTNLSDDLQEPYKAMLAAGCRLEAEVLRTNEVSLSIFDPKQEMDIDIEVIPNGPEVPVAWGRMLNRRQWE